MKLLKLSGPRPIVLHNDDAFGEAYQNPGDPPTLPDGSTEAEQAAYAVVLAEHERQSVRFAAWRRYLETYDMIHLTLVEGRKPVIFMCGLLTPEQSSAIRDISLGERHLHAVKYAVREILNLGIEDEHGGNLGELKARRVDAEYGKALDENSMAVFADLNVLAEVGSHVLASIFLPKGVHKSG